MQNEWIDVFSRNLLISKYDTGKEMEKRDEGKRLLH